MLFYIAKLQILNDIHNLQLLCCKDVMLFYIAKLQILNDIHNIRELRGLLPCRCFILQSYKS